MKKNILSLFIAIASVISVYSTTNDTIRVLAIGNSFSEDAVENYLYDLGKADNVVFIIGNMYIGGCSLETHWINATNNTAAYEYRKINAQGVKTTSYNMKLSKTIINEKWDYITFQQVSNYSGMYYTYFPYLSNLFNYVKARTTNPNVKYALHMTWAYAQNSTHSGFANYNNNQIQMYNAIVDATNRAAETVAVDFVIPSGTAIQNARTSFLGDTFCRDGYHLDFGIGRYTVACAWYEKLTGNLVVGNTYAPSSLSKINIKIAQNAAHFAVQVPKNITYMSGD